MESVRETKTGLENKTKYFISENDNSFIYLEDIELEAFAFLARRGMLNINQLYRFISHATQLTYSSYRAKFSRGFLEKGLVIPREEKWHFGAKKYYRIGTKGVELLMRLGYLDSDFDKKAVYKNTQIKYFDHFLAIEEIVVNAFSDCFRKGLNLENPRMKDFRLDMGKEEDILPLEPDAVLRIDNRYVHLEVDMATEKLSIVREKVERYIELAKDRPDEQHTVVFSLPDSTFEEGERYYTDLPAKRLKNIKEVLLSLIDLHLANFSVYVLPFSRTRSKLLDLLAGERPYKQLIANSAVKAVTKSLELQNKTFDQTFSPIEPSEVLPNHTPGFLMPEGCFAVGNSITSHDHYVIFTFLEEGNIQRMDRLHYVESILEEMKLPVGKIVALYINVDELAKDVLNREYESVIFGDTHALTEYTEDIPVFYRTISPLRKGEVFYEDL